MTQIDAAFVILGLVVATTLLARRFRAPSPVIFAVTGMAAGVAWRLVPGMPVVSMPPDLVLFAFLPPLLVAAYALPLQALRRNALPIGMLAIGLVLATMAVVAVIGHAFAALPWAAALVLGAIVAPPDPVAATAVAGKIGLRIGWWPSWKAKAWSTTPSPSAPTASRWRLPPAACFRGATRC